MTEGLTAGDPLAPRTPMQRPSEPGRASAPPPTPRARRRRGLFGRIVGVVLGVVALGVVGLIGAGFIAYAKFSADLPDLKGLRDYQPRQMSRVYAGDSRLLAELAAERRIFVPYTAMPETLRRAFVSAEDQNFFIHKGVDPVAVLRAVVTDIQQYGQGRRPKGASTITQQVAKNMLVGNDMTLSRKIREALLAIRIERNLSKDRILELYLNEIYLGLSSYGVAAAAQAYFNKPLDELTLAECAFLAGLPKGPNNYNPYRFPDLAKDRRDYVLDRMADDHVVSQDQIAAAKASPVTPAAYQRPDMVTGADYFAEDVRRQLIQKFGEAQTTQGGLVVRTSLDPALQALADKTLRDGLMRYDQARGGWRGPVAHLEGGAAALRANWAAMLSAVSRPPGMLSEWRLGVVIEQTDREARIGVLDRSSGGPQGGPQGGAPNARVMGLSLSDIGWARPVRDDRLGPTPRRTADVAAVGDVVMVEVVASQAPPAANARPGPPPSERLMLRQIPTVQGALVTLDPVSGRVLAMSGGWSYEMSQFNRASQAARQPGSSFKPFVYLTAMEQDISPSQRFLDAPFVLDLGSAGKWRPNNYDLNFNGPTPLRIALEKSLNLVTVRVADAVGMEQVAQTAIAFHVVDSMPRVLPAALGAVETTVLREAAGYAGLAQGGREVIPTLVDSVQDRDGHVLWRAPARTCLGCDDVAKPPLLVDQRREAADPQSTFQVVTMMQGVVARGTGFTAGKGLDRPIAGKTGTSQDFNDAWFVGFTPDMVTAVWIGFDNPTSLGDNQSGATIAAPIWHDYMAQALKGHPTLKFVAPTGVTMASWDSGYGTVTDAFKPGQEPGASVTLGGGGGSGAVAANAGGGPPQPGATAAGVDSGLGGLY